MLSKGSWLVTNQPGRRKILNNYFNLGWIEIIKLALSDAQQEQLDESQLDESQFKKKNTNGKPTFSVIIILIIVICFNLCLLVNIS